MVLNEVHNDHRERWREMKSVRLKEQISRYRWPLLILMAIYTLGILAILRANFYYIDDLGRSLWGYREFQYFSRYIPQYGSVLLHADMQLTDISPLPQLLAVAMMAVSGVIVLHLITGKDSFTWMEYAAMVPLSLSPYFLECLSYKFDAPYMALSVLASVAPVLFYKKGTIAYILSVIVGMLVVCMSYQASSGIFPMLVLLLAMIHWSQKKDYRQIGRFVLLSAGAYLAGMLLFATVLMRPMSQGDYVSGALPPLAEIPFYIFHNLYTFYTTVMHDLKWEWLILIGILFAAFLYTFVRESKQKWYYSLMLGGVGMVFLLVMAYGLYLVLQKPLFEPRAMYGFGVLLCFVGVYVVSALGHREYLLGKAACVALCWCFFVFAFTYGNALTEQQDYTNYRIEAVIDDLDEIGVFDSDEVKTFQITGSSGYAPSLYAKRQDYQILNRLVPVLFQSSDWDWGVFRFEQYYGLPAIRWNRGEENFEELNLPLQRDSIYHTIWADDTHVLIDLKF